MPNPVKRAKGHTTPENPRLSSDFGALPATPQKRQRRDFTGTPFYSSRFTHPVKWIALRYHRNGDWVCEEQEHKTTCNFNESEIAAALLAGPEGLALSSGQKFRDAKGVLWTLQKLPDFALWILIGEPNADDPREQLSGTGPVTVHWCAPAPSPLGAFGGHFESFAFTSKP